MNHISTHSKFLFIIIVSSFFLVSCSALSPQSVNIEEKWPTPAPEQKIVQPEVAKEQSFALKQQREEQEISLVEHTPRKVTINETTYMVELTDFVDEKPRIKVSTIPLNESQKSVQEFFIIGINETFNYTGFAWMLSDVALDVIPTPRKSWVDISFLGVRKNVYVNQNQSFGNQSVMVDFVGLRENVPSARIVVGSESAILARKGEQRFQSGFLYVREVYFNDATEMTYADAITLKVHLIR